MVRFQPYPVARMSEYIDGVERHAKKNDIISGSKSARYVITGIFEILSVWTEYKGCRKTILYVTDESYLFM